MDVQYMRQGCLHADYYYWQCVLSSEYIRYFRVSPDIRVSWGWFQSGYYISLNLMETDGKSAGLFLTVGICPIWSNETDTLEIHIWAKTFTDQHYVSVITVWHYLGYLKACHDCDFSEDRTSVLRVCNNDHNITKLCHSGNPNIAGDASAARMQLLEEFIPKNGIKSRWWRVSLGNSCWIGKYCEWEPY